MPLTIPILRDMWDKHGRDFLTVPNPSGQFGGTCYVWKSGASCRHFGLGQISDVVEPPEDPKELAAAKLRWYHPKLEKASEHYNEIVAAVRLQSHLHGQAGRACPSASEAYPRWREDLKEVNVLIAELQETVSELEDITGLPIIWAHQKLHAEHANEDAARALEEIRELDKLCNTPN